MINLSAISEKYQHAMARKEAIEQKLEALGVIKRRQDTPSEAGRATSEKDASDFAVLLSQAMSDPYASGGLSGLTGISSGLAGISGGQNVSASLASALGAAGGAGTGSLSGLAALLNDQSLLSASTGNGQASSSAMNAPVSSQSQTGSSSAPAISVPQSLEAIFRKASETYGVPENLLKAVAKAESDFNPQSVSSAGAQGIMQLMPGTARALGVTNAFDPEQNIMGGAKYLSQQLSRYKGDVSLALAAYNAGPGNVDKYGGIPPFTETQNYVKRVLKYAGQDLTLPSGGITASAGRTETSAAAIEESKRLAQLLELEMAHSIMNMDMNISRENSNNTYTV